MAGWPIAADNIGTFSILDTSYNPYPPPLPEKNSCRICTIHMDDPWQLRGGIPDPWIPSQLRHWIGPRLLHDSPQPSDSNLRPRGRWSSALSTTIVPPVKFTRSKPQLMHYLHRIVVVYPCCTVQAVNFGWLCRWCLQWNLPKPKTSMLHILSLVSQSCHLPSSRPVRGFTQLSNLSSICLMLPFYWLPVPQRPSACCCLVC